MLLLFVLIWVGLLIGVVVILIPLIIAGERKLKKQAYRALDTGADAEMKRKLARKLGSFKDEEARELCRQLLKQQDIPTISRYGS